MKKLMFIICLLALGLFLSCSDSSSSDKKDSSGGDTTPTTISGTVAGGAPVIGTVYVKDSTGAVKSAVINSNGSYSINVADMTGPFIIYAEGMCGSKPVKLYSFASHGGTANVTPVTTAIVADAINNNPVEQYPADEIKGNDALTNAMPSGDDIDDAAEDMTDLLNDIYDDFGVDSGFDPLTDEFSADNSGFDQILDVLGIDVAGSGVSTEVTITDSLSGTVVFSDVLGDENDPVNNITNISDTAADFAAIVAKVEQWQNLTNQNLSGSLTESQLNDSLTSANIFSDTFLSWNPWAESEPYTADRDTWIDLWSDTSERFSSETARVAFSVQILSTSNSTIVAGSFGSYSINPTSVTGPTSDFQWGLITMECFDSSNQSLGKLPAGKMVFRDVSVGSSNDWRLCGDRATKAETKVAYIQTKDGSSTTYEGGIHFGWEYYSESGPDTLRAPNGTDYTIEMFIIKGQGITDGYTRTSDSQTEHALILVWDDFYHEYVPANYFVDENEFYAGYDEASVTDQSYTIAGLHNFGGETYVPVYYDAAGILSVPVDPNNESLGDISSRFVSLPTPAADLSPLGITGMLSSDTQDAWDIDLTWNDLYGQPRQIWFNIDGTYGASEDPFYCMVEYYENGGSLPDYAEYTFTESSEVSNFTIDLYEGIMDQSGWDGTPANQLAPDDVAYLELGVVSEHESEGLFYITKAIYIDK